MATPSVKAPPATKSLSDESKLRLINNLAKQKFGNPPEIGPRPKSAVSVRSNYSSFHVKSNKEVNIPLLMFFYMFFMSKWLVDCFFIEFSFDRLFVKLGGYLSRSFEKNSFYSFEVNVL